MAFLSASGYWLHIILTVGNPISNITVILIFRRLSFLYKIFCYATAPQWARASSFTRFLDHTQRRTTVGRTPPYEWSARRRDLYQTTHNTHNRQTSMPPVGFEPTMSRGERSQTYALDRAATGIGSFSRSSLMNLWHQVLLFIPLLPNTNHE